LTKADLALMKVLAAKMSRCAILPAGVNELEHWELFLAEDKFGGDDGDMGDTLSFYAPFLTEGLQQQSVGALKTGRVRKLGSLIMFLKVAFDRPRAYQAAQLLSTDHDFTYEVAVTGSTPSFISGHCLQALLASAYLYERLVVTGAHLPAMAVEALKQYASDVGDRRVFAGVHYPSDSLGSWLVALLLTPLVFPAASRNVAKEFVADAIRRSAVYQALLDAGEEVFREALTELERAAH
jgi:hypothetical protein